MSRAWRLTAGAIGSAVGLALLAWQIHLVGLDPIGQGFARVGWWFVAVVALSLFRFTLRAIAWATIVGPSLPFRSAFGATVAGDAIGNLTPLSLIVSEPAKVLYVRHRLPIEQSLGALAAENFFYSVSVAVYILAGTFTLLYGFSIPSNIRGAAWVSLVAMAAILLVAVWILWRRPKLASETLARLPWRWGEWPTRVRLFEARTYEFVNQTRGRLVKVAACEVGFHLGSFAETFLVLWLLTGTPSVLAAFVFDTFQRIVNVVFRIVPLRLGVDETTSGLVAAAVELPLDIGVTIALVRKGRVLVAMAIGLAFSIRAGFRGVSRPLGNQSPDRSV